VCDLTRHRGGGTNHAPRYSVMNKTAQHFPGSQDPGPFGYSPRWHVVRMRFTKTLQVLDHERSIVGTRAITNG
jgi:hypothetical protein